MLAPNIRIPETGARTGVHDRIATTDAEKRDTLMETISILKIRLLKFTEDSNSTQYWHWCTWAADEDLIRRSG